jgi:hypothetical protein
MRRLVFCTLHSSPFFGHTGVHNTFWRITIRFWWPGMTVQIDNGSWNVDSHCQLANSMDKSASAWLYGYAAANPHDSIFLDVWSPGCVPNRHGHNKMIYSMCEVSGFISGGPIRMEESAEIANATFLHIFLPNGLPRLVFLDSGPAMKRSLHALCRQLQLPVNTVSPSNHRAVRVVE